MTGRPAVVTNYRAECEKARRVARRAFRKQGAMARERSDA